MSALRAQDACAPCAQVGNLRYDLRGDLCCGVAPAALAAGADGADSEPVADAGAQGVDCDARLG
jgi:hypothetical protein